MNIRAHLQLHANRAPLATDPPRLSRMLAFTASDELRGDNDGRFAARPFPELRGRYLAQCSRSPALFRVRG